MASTLSSTITHGITLGSGTYASPLMILASGEIAPAGTAETGLYAALAGGYIANAGTILAGTGTTAAAGATTAGMGSIGGIAVDLVAGSLNNTGFIMGGKAGKGGAAQYGGAGGLGGYGVDITGGSLTNQGTIMGGRGGRGGAAVSPASTGYYFGGAGGLGGAGVHLAGGTLINDATLLGGNGGPGGAGGIYYFINAGGVGGPGSAGADVAAGVLVNNGTILGGSGGVGGVSNTYMTPVTASSGGGGIAVQFHAGGTLTNAGFIGRGSGSGKAPDAVDFGTGAARLILAPQASFNGLVVADNAFTNTIELTTGSGAGTLGIVGVQYIGFASLVVDSGANWTLAGAATNSLAANGSLSVYGNLTNTGMLDGAATILVDGNLTNNNTIASLANRRITVNGGMTNAGVIVGTSGSALVISGSLSNGGFIANSSVGTTGGSNGYMGHQGGAGANAVTLVSGAITNTGTLIGGTGGVGGAGYLSGVGGAGSGGAGGTGGAGISVASGAVTNLGTIRGGTGGTGGYGVVITGAPGVGGAGVLFASGGTLTNAGLIASGGNGGDAINFGTGAARLILDPGATFSGTVVANASYADALELASAATAGSLTGLGSTITGFGTIAFDANASWSIAGSSSGIASGETITGFTLGDTIELTGFTATGDTFTGAGLVLAGTGGPKTIDIQGAFSTGSFDVTTASSNTYIALAPPCFAAGTRIATERGDVAVEQLHIGDRVLAKEGRDDAVVWIGRRHVDCSRHPEPHKVWPVRISVDTFGPGQPRRDLYLSPDHAILIDDVLIPVKCLINDASIAQVPMDKVTYYHVELPHHAVLLADGLLVESYLDTGNRSAFSDDSVIALHPDFASRLWEARGCAPLVVSGPKLAAARARCGKSPARACAPKTRVRRSRRASSSPA
jgi:collagen type I alpha